MLPIRTTLKQDEKRAIFSAKDAIHSCNLPLASGLSFQREVLMAYELSRLAERNMPREP